MIKINFCRNINTFKDCPTCRTIPALMEIDKRYGEEKVFIKMCSDSTSCEYMSSLEFIPRSPAFFTKTAICTE